jgi:hypothetical protein
LNRKTEGKELPLKYLKSQTLLSVDILLPIPTCEGASRDSVVMEDRENGYKPGSVQYPPWKPSLPFSGEDKI